MPIYKQYPGIEDFLNGKKPSEHGLKRSIELLREGAPDADAATLKAIIEYLDVLHAELIKPRRGERIN